MEVKTLTLGELGTNCYIVTSAAGNAALIDPADDAQRILDMLSAENAELKMILLTHGHFDHTGAVADLKEQTGAKVYIHAKDECMLDDTIKNVAYLCPDYSYKPFTADVLLSGGDIIRLDEVEFSVMSTPGHTAGSVVFFADNCIFAGDTIFEGSAGRTDFYSGDYIAQRNSLARLAALREDCLIYPGHGGTTTLKQEKQFNPFLGQSSVDFF